MIDGIKVRVLGDSGPFSKGGKSIGYLITIGQSNYILDCGSPLFQQLGDYGLKSINGLIITHCHDDHKRWFTDLAIFYKYTTEEKLKVPLFTSGEVSSELCRMADPPLDRSLSDDSKMIIDISCKDYINYNIIGPAARYQIVSKDKGKGLSQLCVVDSNGNIIGPEKAKIVISDKTGRPRMLFMDPDYKEWVEPESFYPYSSNVFYEIDKNVHHGTEGFTIEAIKAPVWHGIPNYGVKFKTANETLIFSSDTVNDLTLWADLYNEKRIQNLNISKKEFESASIIYGDINDYIERTWSEERYKEATSAFEDAVVIHDITIDERIVHTGYDILPNTALNQDVTLLTHSPDTITSEWKLCSPEKEFKILGNELFEIVDGKLFPMNADIYHKSNGQYFVGYRNEKGLYTVYERNGILCICPCDEELLGEKICRIDLYEDIAGKYFPKIEDDNLFYRKRKDGKIELVEINEKGSQGRVVNDHREGLVNFKKDVIFSQDYS